MKKLVAVLLPIVFTAQACNLFNLSGEQPSGSQGVFQSTDGGQTWAQANTVGKDKTLANALVSRIVFYPKDPKNIMITSNNAGVYATQNSGENWFNLVPGIGAYDGFFKPDQLEEIYVGGTRNKIAVILKSIDSGGSWLQIYTEPAGEGAVTSLIADPGSPSVFYAGLSTGTFLKSLDSGQTWNALTDLSDRIVKVILVPGGKTLYLLGRSQGLRRSVDGGRSWKEIKIADATGIFNDFVIDPGNTNTIYVATQSGLYRSTDEAASWGRLSLPATPEVNNVSTAAVNPKNTRQVFAAIRSTVYRSDDFGVTWRTVSLPTRRTVSTIAINPDEPNFVYAGLK